MGQIVVNVHRSVNVPNTGTITYIPQNTTESGYNNYYFGLGVVFAVILVLIIPVIIIKRKKIIYNTGKFSLFLKKKLLPNLLLLAIFSCGITFSALSIVKLSTNESQATGQSASGDALTNANSDVTIDVEVGDGPTFVYVPSTITIAEATEGGYDLSAYVLNTDLVSPAGDKILSLSSTEATALNENTWGISLNAPTSETDETWHGVSTDETNPLLLKETTATTPPNDTVTIYYGVYITPDLPEGTYTGTINYNTTANLVMQNVTEWGDTVATGQEVFAVDKRDGRKYSVARLKDGKLWMGENLDLGRTELTTDLTSENTNLAETVSAATFNSWKKTEGTRTLNAGEFAQLDGIDETSKTPYGTLYNYYAATAGTIHGEFSDVFYATYDICPSGWRLPFGGYTTGDYKYLIDEYNTYELVRASISEGGAAFALSGGLDSIPVGAGRYGDLWSSNGYDEFVLVTYISNSTGRFGWGYESSRTYGYAMRCIARKPLHNFTISYSPGFENVTINGIPLANGDTMQLEEGLTYRMEATLSEDYIFSDWSATSGTVKTPTSNSTSFIMGNSDTTLTATATFTGTYIQNLDAADCTTTASKVYDSRDMHPYTIQRLKDGNCWMMENLDLGRTALTTDLTSENTNLAETVTVETFNSWRRTSEINSFDEGMALPVEGTDQASGTKYGSLYNYYAASAGTVSTISYDGDVEYDICPAGWRLPTNVNSGEHQALYAQYNSADLMRAPISENGAAYALAGSVFGDKERHGFYWSSSEYSDNSIRILSITPSSDDTMIVKMGSGLSRNSYASIRCILDTPLTISDLTYMQDFNGLSDRDKASVLNSMEDSTVYNLVDNRDNKSYAIAKLKDGNIWMAENLDLGRTELTTDLTSENTNLTETVTAATFNSWKKVSGTRTYDTGEFITLDGADETSQTSYGTLYNYYVASAGTISGESNSDDVLYDICPAGWRLPTGGSSGEFQALYAQYNSYDLMRAPIEDGGAAFTLTGWFFSDVPEYQNVYGYFWSSSRRNNEFTHNLSLTTSDVSTSSNRRYYGNSVRCVLNR